MYEFNDNNPFRTISIKDIESSKGRYIFPSSISNGNDDFICILYPYDSRFYDKNNEINKKLNKFLDDKGFFRNAEYQNTLIFVKNFRVTNVVTVNNSRNMKINSLEGCCDYINGGSCKKTTEAYLLIK